MFTQNAWEHTLLAVCSSCILYCQFFLREEGRGVEGVFPVEGDRGVGMAFGDDGAFYGINQSLSSDTAKHGACLEGDMLDED